MATSLTKESVEMPAFSIAGMPQRSVTDRSAFSESAGRLVHPSDVIVKRAVDLILGIPLALFGLPLVLAAALAVKLVSPGPAFFVQEREGRGGRRIRVWKIRTMVPDAAARLEQHLAADPGAWAEWQQYVKLRHDPRIIPYVGRFLRRSSIDELPQLWSILLGEMSLVGPRPFPDYHLEKFPSEFRALRRQVVPGMTGLWQIRHRSNGNLTAQEQADTEYILNWSLGRDLWILVRTLPAVIGGNGAY